MLDDSSIDPVPVQRVKKSYEQIADQLRELILAGQLAPGTKLPTEPELAAAFRSSRSTVREALRTLSAEGLVRSTKGRLGGTFVSEPTLEDVSHALNTSIGLLSRSAAITLDEFLEARELFEVPAARLSALRRTDADVERLAAVVPDDPHGLSHDRQFVANREFHSTIVDVCSNALLSLAARPIFIALQTHLTRTALDSEFHETINEHHRMIAAAIAAQDPDQAGALMEEHLAWLRPYYERTWTAG